MSVAVKRIRPHVSIIIGYCQNMFVCELFECISEILVRADS